MTLRIRNAWAVLTGKAQIARLMIQVSDGSATTANSCVTLVTSFSPGAS